MTHDVKMVVVACNTASSLAINFLKRCFRVPVIGVIEPGAIGAVKVTRNKRIGVIGTHATISSGAYEEAIKKISSGISVFTKSCPLFVPLVEEGWLDNKVTDEIAHIYLSGFRSRGVDTLILGCTHYPLLKRSVRKVMGDGVMLVDSAMEVANQAKALMDSCGLSNAGRAAGKCKFFVSDEPGRFINMAERFLKRRIKCDKRQT